MQCEKMANYLSPYLDGELSPEDRRRFEAHLADCPTCQASLTQFQRLDQLYKEQSTHKAPDNFEAAVHDRIARSMLEFPRRERKRRVWPLALAAAMLLLLSYPVLRPVLAPTERLQLSQAEEARTLPGQVYDNILTEPMTLSAPNERTSEAPMQADLADDELPKTLRRQAPPSMTEPIDAEQSGGSALKGKAEGSLSAARRAPQKDFALNASPAPQPQLSAPEETMAPPPVPEEARPAPAFSKKAVKSEEDDAAWEELIVASPSGVAVLEEAEEDWDELPLGAASGRIELGATDETWLETPVGSASGFGIGAGGPRPVRSAGSAVGEKKKSAVIARPPREIGVRRFLWRHERWQEAGYANEEHTILGRETALAPPWIETYPDLTEILAWSEAVLIRLGAQWYLFPPLNPDEARP